ncbi:hypothetical protein NLG97_g6049 [Lecanicillium saksenae]|uniref:Uncharacterized protein n=1 Tax=Lecanicillium saksenae TaxID=468837 RepID=A0ACC1QQQ4_9HYPO|nr:hypothetical protein NLG97_g6049 [Lecanicillium saksenae]
MPGGRDDWSEQQQRRFEVALGQVVQLLPGEMESRNLLQPIEGTGAAKLHEIGLRVRHYSKFLKAWEELHIFHVNGDGTYILDNIIQHIYYQARIASSESRSMYELDTAVHTYEAYRDFMMKFGQLLFPWTEPYSTSHMALRNQFRNGGRGIVLTAGDAQAEFLMTGIPLLRKLGCMLPIEVMYLGDEDLDEDNRSQLEALGGVITRDMKPMVNDSGWKLAGWAAKPFAVLFSSFREVVFIDADSLFFQNPEVLFHEPAYTRSGALFFKDRAVMAESRREWLQQVLPKPISAQVKNGRFWTGDSGHMQESGVLVIDKWRHFIALLVVARMNGPERDGNSAEGRVGVYDMVYGDKETFWIGWELAGDLDYAFHDGSVAAMGVVEGGAEEPLVPRDDTPRQQDGTNVTATAKKPNLPVICSPQLLHLDLDGRPLWFNGCRATAAGETTEWMDNREPQQVLFIHALCKPEGT